MADYRVSTKFTAKDNVSGAFKKMGAGAEKFGKQTTNAFKQSSKSASQFGSVLKGVLAASAVQKGLMLITQGVQAATTDFIEFDDAIIGASAKFKGLNLTTQKGQQTLEALKKTARDVGAATQFSASQAASGLDFLAMAGFNAEQAISALPGVVDLATVAKTDLARATDIASDSLGAFGLMTQDAGQLATNFTRINDVFAKTMTSSNTNMEDLFEAVKKGAPAFTAAGQSLETFNALAGVMANSGVKGAESGTALRNVMLRLSKPTGEAAKVLKGLGVVTKDSKGNFRDVVDILADIEKGSKKMGTAQKTAALATVFGARSVTGVNILLGEGTDKLRAYREELLGAAGASETMAGVMRTSLKNQLASLQSALLELAFKVFTKFEKQGAGAIQSLTQAVREFDPTPIVNGIQAAIRFTINFKNTVVSLFDVVKNAAIIFSPFIAALVAYKATVKAIAMFQIAQQIFAFMKAAKLATAAQWLFNIALNANPIGLVVAAIALVVTGLILLVKNWDTVKEAFINGGKAILEFFQSLFKTVSSVFDIFSSMMGFGGGDINAEQTQKTEFTPPNLNEARAQKIDFLGQINITGAPQGSSAQSSTKGAPDIPMVLLGAN